MRKFLFLSSTIAFAFVLAPLASADTGDVTVVQGCDVVDMGGYSNKVDPTCAFDGLGTGGAAPIPNSTPVSGLFGG